MTPRNSFVFSCGLAAISCGVAEAQTPPSSGSSVVPAATNTSSRTAVAREAAPMKFAAPTFGNGTSMLAPGIANAADRAGSALAFFNPSLTYSFQYGDGLASSSGNDESTVIQQLTPTVFVVFAEKTNLTYSPSYTWYSSDSYESTVSHTASASASWQTGEVVFNFGQNYARTNSPLIETGLQTEQETWATNFDASYPLGDKTRLSGGLGRSVRNTDLFTDVETWSGNVALSRVVNPALTGTASVAGSYSSFDTGADLVSRSVNVGASWKPGVKASANLSAGLNFSGFTGDGKQSTSPIYSGSLTYQLFETTGLSLSGQRSVNTSYFSNQFTRDTSYQAALSQRIFQRFFFSGTLSWTRSSYIGRTPGDLPVAREDDSWMTSAQISTQILRKFSTALTWSHTEIDSNFPGVTRTSTLYGISISWRF